MDVRMEMDQLAKGLDAGDHAWHHILSPEHVAVHVDHGQPRAAGEFAEQAAVVATVDAQPFGDREDELPVGDGCADRVGDRLGGQQGSLLMAACTKATLLTGEGDEHLVVAVGAADPGETEVHVADRDAMIGILAGIGFGVSIEYRKTRESWELGGATVELDTLDFGRFVEIEGTQEQIRRAAKLLGLEMAEAERRGYPSMMRAHEAAARPADIESLDAPDGSRTGVDADRTRARPPD